MVGYLLFAVEQQQPHIDSPVSGAAARVLVQLIFKAGVVAHCAYGILLVRLYLFWTISKRAFERFSLRFRFIKDH